MGVNLIQIFNKISAVGIITFLVISSSNISISEKQNYFEQNCYGFIIPLPQGDDSTIETFEISRVRHLINDLLRGKIDVYWLSKNISIKSRDLMNNNNLDSCFFEKGAFIVPFTGISYIDTLIISIVNDYNSSSEIDNDDIKIKSYLIMESSVFDGYKLKEVKIAQHLGIATRYSWPCYLLIADAGGFLTFEFIDDFETSSVLNNDDFNVFMWPYEPNPSTIFEVLKSLSDYKGLNTIRDFVNNGGGFIGSCYGAESASAGFIWPIPAIYIRRVYNPNLKVFPFYSFAISDTWMRGTTFLEDLLITTSKIKNHNHPMSYGLNDTFQEFFNGGWYKWVGKKTEPVAVYSDLIIINEDTNLPGYMKKSIIDSPSHISTTFGDGKVVEFTSHPEFIINISILFNNIPWEGDKYYGRRTIFNTLNYVTAEQENVFAVETFQELIFVEEVIKSTKNLLIDENINSEFNDIISKIITLKNYIDTLENKVLNLKYLYSEFDNKYEIFKKGRRHIGYILHYSIIYDDFLNRSISTLEQLENVYQMYKAYNSSAKNDIAKLKKDIQMRIENATKIIDKIFDISEKIEAIFQKNTISIFGKLRLINYRRNLISEYELNLKYIPQQLFNSLKILRKFWYNYEAELTLENSKQKLPILLNH
ncbi:MAG: hypothetical protein JSV67_00990 [Thermoplasmatales archaeon]|nr:MAG: hypothetical protein JSV67_00990 [Thermoplasmatales archaeon]